MKLMTITTLVLTALLVGCASKVTTYDSTGRMIGSCSAQSGFMIGAGAHCEGKANQEGRDR